MIGSRAPFTVGQRVKPSQYGIERRIFNGDAASREGEVKRVDRFNAVIVRWDGRKSDGGYYHPDFIDPVK